MLPLAPAIGLLLVFLAGPILYCVYAAFTNMALTGTGAANVQFVGLDNFRKAFGSGAFTNVDLADPGVHADLRDHRPEHPRARPGAADAPVAPGGAQLRRYGGDRRLGAARGGRGVPAGSAFFNDDGTLNVILHAVGLPGQDWLYAAPIIAVSLANIWRGTAFSMLVYSAALSEVPKEIEEAAEMDGAAGARRLIFVTLPMISRAIMTNLMLITLQTLSVFGLIFAMTRGGPGTKSQTLPLYMYEQAFSFSQIGYGTAIALVMLPIGAVFSLIYLRGLQLGGTHDRPRPDQQAGRQPGAAGDRCRCSSCRCCGCCSRRSTGPPGCGSSSRPSPTLGNFKAVLNTDTTYRPVLNGIVLCGGAALLTMICAVLAAYPLSRFKSKFNRPFLLTVLFCTGLPITAVMVPVYGLFVQLNLVDTLGGTIMFMATSSLPFAIWLTKTFMDGVPISLEEAAWVDGAGNMQALRSIVLPLMWPGIAVVLIFTFIGMWGNFFVPFMLLLSPERLPASVSIFTFFGQYGEPNYGQLAAYSLHLHHPRPAALPVAEPQARRRLRPRRRHQGLRTPLRRMAAFDSAVSGSGAGYPRARRDRPHSGRIRPVHLHSGGGFGVGGQVLVCAAVVLSGFLPEGEFLGEGQSRWASGMASA